MQNRASSLHILNNGDVTLNKEILSVNKPDKEGISRGTAHSFQESEYFSNANYKLIKEIEKFIYSSEPEPFREYSWQYADYDKEYSPKELKQKIKEETRSNQGKIDEQFS